MERNGNQNTSPSRFMEALHGRRPDTTPIWIMRQAGRYLPEYRELRARHSFLEMCKEPELAARVTLMPLKRFELDAAILFSDILIPLEAMGLQLDFLEGEGPRLAPVVRDERALAALDPALASEATPFVPAAIRRIKAELPRETPLIGFSGAPFTLLCYAVEGGGSKDFHHAKEMMFARPALFHQLMETITRAVEEYLLAQVAAGVDAIQLFDTWAGILSRADYERCAWPYVQRLIRFVRDQGVPVIYFVLDGAHLQDLTVTCGAQALGVDWRIPLPAVRALAGPDLVLQGNLDPGYLNAPEEILRPQVAEIIRTAGGPHIFNLGHGIWPDVPPEQVRLLVNLVHEIGKTPER